MPAATANMDAKQIIDRVIKAKGDFGPKCRKYAGAVTVEVLREAIRDAGYHVSPRDSFIRGVPIEVDLLVVRPGVEPQFGCLYEPSDVFAAIEIKNHGAFTGSTVATTRKNFEEITKASARIKCCYVTLAERKGYKYAVTNENLGYPAFTLFWYTASKNNTHQEDEERTEPLQTFLDWVAKAKI